jgi:hypothetical protein
MLDKLLSEKYQKYFLLFHILLGVLSVQNRFVFIAWFYLVLLTSAKFLFSNLRREGVNMMVPFVTYITSFEILGRLSDADPFVPYELSKYFLLLVGIIGIFRIGIKDGKGAIMILLLLPSLFFDSSHQVVFFDIVHNAFAPLGLAVMIAFISKASINEVHFNNALRLIWLTSVSCLVNIILKTPDYNQISFNLAAQFDTTGGESSNQIATLLGLGMFLSFYAFFYRLKFSGYVLVDLGFLFGFAWQGLLTFSRGGMVVAVFAVLIIVLMDNSQSVGKAKVKFRTIMIGLISLFLVFTIINDITNGQLILRYQGETEGTLAGTKEKTKDSFLTGRASIADDDLDLWFKNIFFGVGSGASRYMRVNTQLVSPHVELTRILAENGIFGLVYFIILIAYYKIIYLNKDKRNRAILSALFFIAIITTFHASMRTYITPLLVVLSILSIKRDENFIHRNG